MGKRLRDLFGMIGYFLNSLGTVQMLASGDEPHIELFEVDHHRFLFLTLVLLRSAISARIHACSGGAAWPRLPGRFRQAGQVEARATPRVPRLPPSLLP